MRPGGLWIQEGKTPGLHQSAFALQPVIPLRLAQFWTKLAALGATHLRTSCSPNSKEDDPYAISHLCSACCFACSVAMPAVSCARPFLPQSVQACHAYVGSGQRSSSGFHEQFRSAEIFRSGIAPDLCLQPR